MSGKTAFELVFRGERHGPFAPLAAARFVHANAIPLNAAVRVVGRERLWPLRRFPALAQASKSAARGRAMPPLRESGNLLTNGADYTPNHLTAGERLFALVWGVGLVWLTLWGLEEGRIPVVGGTRGARVMIAGGGLWFMAAANLLFSSCCLITIIDHYDRRNNELPYRRALLLLGGLGVVSMVLAIVLGVGDSSAR